MCLVSRVFICSAFCLAAGALPSSAAENFEEYLQRQRSGLEQQRQAFDDFKSAEDARFHGFLQRRWQEFRQFKGEPEDKKPKPRDIPRVPLKEPRATEIVQPPTLKPLPKKPQKKLPQKGRFSFLFFEQRLEWQVARDWRRWQRHRLGQLNERGVAKWWKAFSALDAQPIVKQINAAVGELRLNDWGRLQLAYHFARALGLDHRRAVLTTWGLAVRAGLSARLAYSRHQPFLYFESQQKLFSVPYFMRKGRRYYQFIAPRLTVAEHNIKTYQGEFGEDLRPLDLAMRRAPLMTGNTVEKTFAVDWQGRQHQFRAQLRPPMVRYLDTLPQQAIDAYFKFEPSEELRHALVPQLKQTVKSMNARAATHFLLRFVQTAFVYATDDEQFRRENYLLPEETLHYPRSDCEDRALLFAWLAREAAGLDVVGLDYPGHIAAAVHLPEASDKRRTNRDKRYIYRGRRYTVADPTYVNAAPGQEMPEFSGRQVRVIPIRR